MPAEYLCTEAELYPVPKRLLDPSLSPTPHINSIEQYKKLYDESIKSPAEFWGKIARETLIWATPFQTVLSGDFEHGDIAWFLEGQLNATYNCVDRHAIKNPDKVAIIYEADEPGQDRKITYGELLRDVCRLANALKAHGVRKGDIVTIYMPMIPEAIIAFLSCARLGALHSVVFAGFSAESLRGRIQDASSKFVITADDGRRGGKTINIKNIVDDALKECSTVERVFVFRRTATTLKYVFDYHEGDIFGCMADIGWITGHTYVVYGPLACGGTSVLFESTPLYPTPSRYWEVVAKHKITHFYTAPTAIRLLHRFGREYIDCHDLSSLRIIASVGEPIDPESWKWYYEVVCRNVCSVIDTYWQTETGSTIISPLPYAILTKPGSATLPFFGIDLAVLDSITGKEITTTEAEGVLVIRQPWPSIARTIYNDHNRYVNTYLKPYKGYYFTGDCVIRDRDGYYWIRGRVDDVINVSGHRISTSEIESALDAHHTVAETAVIGVYDELTGQSVHAFVTLKPNCSTDVKELTLQIRKVIGPFAAPKKIYIVSDLPKTRSGKIMRRVLRKIISNETDQLGDLSTLSDPNLINILVDKVNSS
ncbi:30880_t:CDS:2 [Gigaspora margarita]|uniref:acetate--CoA ligase n=1 Tax=Gigaspora margarita TaxID=4874 RepID=A0ABN7UXE0_GIGMA|nr:30880_t:CDS:2 [Gigaspora margarita]